MIDGLHHVQLAMPVGREADAVAFYAGALGMTVVPKPDHLAVRGGCWFESGSAVVHLGVDPEFRPATKAHPALVTSDLDAVILSVERSGAPVITDQPLAGFRRVYVLDPFGNRIELLQPNP